MNVPKLRFPEFRDAGEWEDIKLGDVAPLQRGFDLPSDQLLPGSIPVYYSNGIQSYHNIGMAKGPGLITGRSGTIGKIHYINDGEYWPHNTALWVTSFKGNCPKFIYFYYCMIGMERFASGSGVPTLNRNYVHDFHGFIPSLPEQQKIADCLSSLDELIAAHNQKLAALKLHKKGLMQQFFPADGETVPRLRFPEFRDAGEWEEKALSDLFKLQSGYAFQSAFFGNQGQKLLTPKNFTQDGYGNFSQGNMKFTIEDAGANYICKPGDLLLLITDLTPSCELLGKPLLLREADGDLLLNQRIVRLIETQSIVAVSFLHQFFLTNLFHARIKCTASGSTVRHSSNKIIMETIIRLPSLPEQQKIADCLSSLDELIAAQVQKVEALKAHKKGLMQQLFPATEEVQV